jgi:CheY-like chemotaxis protein
VSGARRFALLVIDDSLADRQLLRRALEPHGVEVVTVASGIEGIEAAQHHRPDAVVCDWNMPGLDGKDVIEVLRSQPGTRRIRIIVLTGDSDPVLHRHALDLGADDVVVKPGDVRALADSVLAACGF